ncbi:phospho-N-acetylmuramoyl-pentapeptide-transferase [Actinocatenispora rupis]|uniref:Phospho-N-acetylmuramoyl-pentapeptide-transferase n=1 Tax=Actinocatenispora rupis TaxID=519421 RepID=A0A8J3NA28_9ACTN|nr:phospho-N-acetylmuramoyl-pentapeptide-transferase [Actinocatenispora rupis]GID09290.1 phospho-N-acetylmuramoyl-pentapeptide-transferase [Actinocatenispora rupis]
MRSVIVAPLVAFVLTLFGTPLAIRYFSRLRADQPIREIGPQSHLAKRGTPTMGGVVFIVATVIAYLVGHLTLLTLPGRPHKPTVTAIVLLGLFVCMGAVGFIDDFMKIRRRNSAGLSAKGKLLGQALVGAVFGVVALYFNPDSVSPDGIHNPTVGSSYISFIRDIPWLDITRVGAVVLFIFVVLAASNGVNLTDGLDGLATGTSVMVLLAYTVISFWQYRHWCSDPHQLTSYCYAVRDPLDAALIAGAAAGALFGFLWWNASPARIFMGDSGALGLGGLIGGLAISTKTILLLFILGALFVIETVSLIIQVVSFRSTGRRVFRMAPIHHHFELAGWSEVNITVRFWIISGIGITAGLAIFYADFTAHAIGSNL